VVEEYLAKAVMTGWMAERIPGGESLILKEGWVFNEGCIRLLCDGYKSAIIALVTVGSIGTGWDCIMGSEWLVTSLVLGLKLVCFHWPASVAALC
jgi:hypothetical protein